MHRALAPESPSSNLPTRLAAWPYWTVILGLCLAGAAALAIDFHVGNLVHTKAWPKAVLDQLQRAEVFGYGVTVGVILLVVVVLDPAKRLLIPRLLLMVYGAGLAADGIKLLLARTRPRDFQFTGTIWNSFGKLLPLGHGGSSQHSFPSAHTATAVALAVTLAALYPRGRWLFGVFAALVGCQRIVSGAHFASDVFWGASLGWLVAVGVGRANLDWVPRRSHEDDAPPAGSEGSG